MPILENAQHEKFVQELVKGKGQGEAYLAAGYKAKSVSVASAAATRLLKDVKISARLNELREVAKVTAIETTSLSRAWVLQKLIENVQRAMTAEPVYDTQGNETGEYKYQGNVANRALELLGKEVGMFIERKEVGKPGDFADVSDEELDKFLAENLGDIQAGSDAKH